MENALLRQNDISSDASNVHRDGPGGQAASSCIHDVLMVLAQEMKKAGSNGGPYPHDNRQGTVESPSSSNGRAFSYIDDSHISPQADNYRRKRRRIDGVSSTHAEHHSFPDDLHDLAAQLPPTQVMNAIVESYFAVIHPWIPMLHQSLFISRLNDPQQRPGLTVILHAMVAAALRFVDEGIRSAVKYRVDDLVKKSRNTVILIAFDSLSVENLQALTIITFDDVWAPKSNFYTNAAGRC